MPEHDDALRKLRERFQRNLDELNRIITDREAQEEHRPALRVIKGGLIGAALAVAGWLRSHWRETTAVAFVAAVAGIVALWLWDPGGQAPGTAPPPPPATLTVPATVTVTEQRRPPTVSLTTTAIVTIRVAPTRGPTVAPTSPPTSRPISPPLRTTPPVVTAQPTPKPSPTAAPTTSPSPTEPPSTSRPDDDRDDDARPLACAGANIYGRPFVRACAWQPRR